jgi:hypothetical protein
MSDRPTAAQHGADDSNLSGFAHGRPPSNLRHWRCVGIGIALAVVAACGGGGETSTGGSGGNGGAGTGGSGGSSGNAGGTTAGASGSSGATGSGGAAGSAGAGTAGSAGRGGAGASGSGGTAGAIDGGSKDAGSGGTAGSTPTDGGTRDASQDTSPPTSDVAGDTLGGNLTVVSVDPTARGIQAATNAPIVIHFDRPVKRDTVTNKTFWAYGRWGGPVRPAPAAYTFSDSDKAVSFAPPRNWPAGDRVTVVLSHDLQGADGSKLRSQGYSFQYSTATKAANQTYTEIGRITSRTNSGTTVRTYGGSVADLNNDGYLDLLTINEDAADMRIFMNKGDGTGAYNAFVQPTTPVGHRASPSETTDFNGDGIVDIVVANLNDDTLSVLFGKNDGTFTTSQTPAVGGQPRGVAVIDVDGDGDIDIINTNADGDNLSLLVNDGTGKFPATQAAGIIFFDSLLGTPGTVSQEFGLFSGDMNEDGILDIVIGARGINGMNAGTVVDLGTGTGNFTFGSNQGPQTSGWQLVVGDLNGDGHEDIATADSDLTTMLSKNTVTVLIGDGKGKATPQTPISGYFNKPFAIDTGDIDGDKDLDLVVSNYTGNWQILLNDGAGKYTASQKFQPAQSASCALLIDIDNDQDLDLVVVDEEEDQVVILRQSP